MKAETKLIKWSLLSDNVLVHQGKSSYKIEDNIIIYKDEDFINKIDLDKRLFIRENNEYKIILDFHNKEQRISIKDKEIIDDLNGYIKKNNNIINIRYNSFEEEKEIIIHLL